MMDAEFFGFCTFRTFMMISLQSFFSSQFPIFMIRSGFTASPEMRILAFQILMFIFRTTSLGTGYSLGRIYNLEFMSTYFAIPNFTIKSNVTFPTAKYQMLHGLINVKFLSAIRTYLDLTSFYTTGPQPFKSFVPRRSFSILKAFARTINSIGIPIEIFPASFTAQPHKYMISLSCKKHKHFEIAYHRIKAEIEQLKLF